MWYTTFPRYRGKLKQKKDNMEKHFFRYQILRYVADLRRMETENFGIVVQDHTGASCRFQTHVGNRSGFDHENYLRWRTFFNTEIKGPPVPFFQPERSNIEFLNYLQERCTGNYSLTRPLELVLDAGDLKDAEDYLFRTLVLKADEAVAHIKQPVQQLRHELVKRGILGHPKFHVKDILRLRDLNELLSYYYFRDERDEDEKTPVIIQQVQNRRDLMVTANEMVRAEAMVANFEAANLACDLTVVVDDIPEPDAKDSDAKKWNFDTVQRGKENLSKRGVKVVDSTKQAVRLADGIEKDLDEIELVLSQPELAL